MYLETMRTFRTSGRHVLLLRIHLVLLLLACTASSVLAQQVSGTVTEYIHRAPFEVRQWNRHPGSSGWRSMALGDLDGDGCADLIVNGDDARWYVYASDCHSSFRVPQALPQLAAVDTFIPFSTRLDQDRCEDLVFDGKDGRWTFALSNCRAELQLRPMRSHGATYERIAAGRIMGDPVPVVAIGDADFIGYIHPVVAIRPTPIPPRKRVWLTGRLRGFADINGDGADEIVVLYPPNHQHRAISMHRLEPYEEKGPWTADWPSRFMWVEEFLGDFNGDGFDDILHRGSGLAGWWLAASNGSTGIEQPVFIPLGGAEETHLLASGDVNGDGIREIVRCPRYGEGDCEIARIIRGSPISQAVILQHGKRLGATNAQGEFSVTLTDGAPIEIQHPDYRFTNPWRRIIGATPLHFLGVSHTQLRAQVGRAIYMVQVPQGPKVCLSYVPNPAIGDKKWGERELCPNGFGWYSNDDTYPHSDPVISRLFRPICCPLPADDILQEPESERYSMRCPKGMVAVGAAVTHTGKTDTRELYCAKINEERYLLGPEVSGKYVGDGASSRFSGERFAPHQIPSALKHGVTRTEADAVDVDGCIGSPVASLYVGNSGEGRCESHLFRPLLYRGLSGDPPQGTPVEMYPPCSAVVDPLDPTTGCYP